MARYTTAIFEAAELWYDRLSAASFPAHPVTNQAPEVDFGDVNPQAGYERIGLVVLDPEQAQTEWATVSPAGRDETFVLQAITRSIVPRTTTALAAWQRLAALNTPIEDTLFDRVAQTTRTLGFDGEIDLGITSSISPGVFPIEGGGWGGVSIVSARFRARR